MSRSQEIQIGDVITIEELPCGYAQHTIQGLDFWITFVEWQREEGNDALILVIAERLAAINEARVVDKIQIFWNHGEGMDIPPKVLAEAKQKQINDYFITRFGEADDNPFHLWGYQVVVEWRTWHVDGITLVFD